MFYGLNERYNCCLSYSIYTHIVIQGVGHINWYKKKLTRTLPGPVNIMKKLSRIPQGKVGII